MVRARKTNYILGLILFGMIGGLFFFIGCESSQTSLANLSEPQGPVQARKNDSGTFQAAKDKDALDIGGAVRTGENGTTKLTFKDGTEVAMRPEAYFELRGGDTLGLQTEGAVFYKIQKQKSGISVQTPQGITAVLGTTFIMKIASQATNIWVEEGKVSFTNKAGDKREINPGQKIEATADGKLKDPVDVDPFERESIFNPGGVKLPKINQH